MADAENQRVAVVERQQRYDWKRRAAIALLGEPRARAAAGRLTDVRAWGERSLSARGRANNEYLRGFKNIHAGRRCVIMGNGPSLNKTELRLLRDEYTFGLNRIYLMFEKMGFETSYLVVANRYVIEQCTEDFRRLTMPLFTTWQNSKFFEGKPNVGYFSDIVGPRFSPDVTGGIWDGATVTYQAMQLAYYMGFTEVVLVGVDHRFATTGPNHQLVVSEGPDASHFDPNYFGKGFKWELPNLETSEVSYRMARANFEMDGRRIVDATVDGALTVFPKMSLAEALGR
jgi:hypothetical protein